MKNINKTPQSSMTAIHRRERQLSHKVGEIGKMKIAHKSVFDTQY